jgi:hypothetical protein
VYRRPTRRLVSRLESSGADGRLRPFLEATQSFCGLS